MTDRGRQARRLAALGLVPLTVGGFGSAVAWSASHQPTTPTPSAPSATATTDPQLTEALAEIADARNRIAALQATLDQQAANAQAGPVPSQPGAAPIPAAKAPGAKAPAAKAPGTAAAPVQPAPAPPPPVHTTTKASG